MAAKFDDAPRNAPRCSQTMTGTPRPGDETAGAQMLSVRQSSFPAGAVQADLRAYRRRHRGVQVAWAPRGHAVAAASIEDSPTGGAAYGTPR